MTGTRSAYSILVLSALLVSGCVSTSRVDGLESRIRDLEEDTKKERVEFEHQLKIAKEQVKELKKVLKEATAVVTRNSADLGLEVKEVREEIGRLEGQIAELRNENAGILGAISEQDAKVNKFARSAGVDVPIDPSQIPSDKNKHYSKAYKAYQNRDLAMARGLFNEYVKRYPGDYRNGDATYWVGMSYEKQQRPANALEAFKTVLTKYPDSAYADDALLEMANAFWELHSCDDARTAIEAFLKKFPRSNLVKQARANQRKWKRPPSDYCR